MSWGKSDKMRGLSSISLLFRKELNKFNYTGARMLESIYHMTLEFIKNRIFGVKMSRLYQLLRNAIMDIRTSSDEICKPLVVLLSIIA